MTVLEYAETTRTIEALKKFVRDLLDDDYDYVVPVERKGTALVRAALAEADTSQWKRVVSSSAIKYVLADQKGKRVLVLDDSVWRGSTLARTTELVRASGVDTKVTTAAFISHRRAPDDCLDIVYDRGLDDESYKERREALIEYLQQEGSLLLDTEHVEVRTRIHCSISDFFEAFAGWGEAAVRYVPGSNRVNCTVFQLAENLLAPLKEVTPGFADLEGAVCKIRVVSHPKDSQEFSLIPICYPFIRITEDTRFDHPRMTWTRKVVGETRIFQCVGLALAVQMLVHAMSWVRAELGRGVDFDHERSPLEHLRAVFPEVDVGQLRAELSRLEDTKATKSTRSKVVDDPGMGILRRLADEIRWSCFDRYEPGFLRKLKLRDVLAVGPLHGQPPARASAALDVLIDEAKILPETVFTPLGNTRAGERAFGPDGEIVARELIREALLSGKGIE